MHFFPFCLGLTVGEAYGERDYDAFAVQCGVAVCRRPRDINEKIWAISVTTTQAWERKERLSRSRERLSLHQIKNWRCPMERPGKGAWLSSRHPAWYMAGWADMERMSL